MLMDNKTYALEVYNALNDTDYTDPEAVETAIDECIREHILEDFFLARKDEVMKMTQLDYTWEKREKMIRKEEFKDGEEKGVAKVAANMLAQNMSEEMILQLTGLTIEELQGIRSVGNV